MTCDMMAQDGKRAERLTLEYSSPAERLIQSLHADELLECYSMWFPDSTPESLSTMQYEQLVCQVAKSLHNDDIEAKRRFQPRLDPLQSSTLWSLEVNLIKQGCLPPLAACYRKQYDDEHDRLARRPSLYPGLPPRDIPAELEVAIGDWERRRLLWHESMMDAVVRHLGNFHQSNCGAGVMAVLVTSALTVEHAMLWD